MSVTGFDTLCVIKKLLFIVPADVDQYQKSIIVITCSNIIDTKDHLSGVGEAIFGVD
jgi:hypothetical protein